MELPGEKGPAKPKTPVAEAVDKFLEKKRADGWDEKSIRTVSYALKQFASTCPKAVEDVGEDDACTNNVT